ncbi:MAG: hypothetical protein R3254_04240 [Thiomicrorhabdus sp.]|nr:hypothetical protein [Thiomicrorhabdus sp.]
MSVLASQNIVLVGLPGAGKTTVAGALNEQFACSVLHESDCSEDGHSLKFTRPGCFEWQEIMKPPVCSDEYVVWCVIDIRSTLPAQNADWLAQSLQNLLKVSDGVLFTFSENSSLDTQAWWNKWLTKNRCVNGGLPTARMFNNGLPQQFNGFTKFVTDMDNAKKETCSEYEVAPDVEHFHFEVECVVLDHLLMVLDNARQNLAMKITRVVGTLKTLEYQNLVAIEGTPYRWDTYAAKTDKQVGQLKISGIGLDQAWLNEMIQACRV